MRVILGYDIDSICGGGGNGGGGGSGGSGGGGVQSAFVLGDGKQESLINIFYCPVHNELD